MNPLLNAALRYAELGYRVFPCAPGAKTPLTKHGFQDATTNEDQISEWWRLHPSANVAIATEGLVVIDVDGAANPWLTNEPERAHELAIAPLSLTPGGGRHYVFRAPGGKSYRGQAGRLAPRVDVRADGGYIVVPPSVLVGGKAYRWAEGMELDVPPEKLPDPPAWLVQALDQWATSSPTAAHVASGGDDANTIPSGQRNATLARLAGTMRRVGMSQGEIVAALHVTNNSRCVPPLSTVEVERIAESVARYEPDQISVAVVENHWEQMAAGRASADETIAKEKAPSLADPGPIPERLLRVPGFVAEVMDHCLETAPYPNLVLAFAGALALQAFLAGRKVRDQADNRTNLYLLGLAYSSAGKDQPRKLNTRIIHEVGLASALGEKFTSGEAIQDALNDTPCMLFQTDEIDGMLQSINKAKDARHESTMGTLLTMYSSANSVYPMRRKANPEATNAIDQPCLIVYGTAIPNHYYEALSERMLTNGFFARMVILECPSRSAGKEPGLLNPPARVLDTARWWADFHPGTGNLEKWHPVPAVVQYTPEAQNVFIESRLFAEAKYSEAESQGDPVGTTVWGRVNEQARKLALLYAISRDHKSASIDHAAAQWATTLVVHQTQRMLFMAQNHASANPFHADCLKFVRKLREAPEQTLPHSVLLKRMKVDSQAFQHIVQTLTLQGDIECVSVPTPGRYGVAYRLLAP